MEIIEFKSTGSGVVSLACSQSSQFRLLNVTAHAASNVASALIITLDSGDGATYDTVLSSVLNWTDILIEGEPTAVFRDGDVINVTCADNAVVKGVIVRLEVL